MRSKLLQLILTVFVFFLSTNLGAWDGTDEETGNDVEIEAGNLVRLGNDIEIYDSEDGSYHDAEVQSIRLYGNTVEVEVYDYEEGECRTLEMEDN